MCARRRTHFLCFAKESRQSKATRLPVTRSVAAGTLLVLALDGVRANSLHCVSLKQRAALFRPTLRFSARADGTRVWF
jgi:hypothetical protein